MKRAKRLTRKQKKALAVMQAQLPKPIRKPRKIKPMFQLGPYLLKKMEKRVAKLQARQAKKTEKHEHEHHDHKEHDHDHKEVQES